MVFYSKKQNALYDGYCMFIIAPIIVGSSFGPADTLPLGGGVLPLGSLQVPPTRDPQQEEVVEDKRMKEIVILLEYCDHYT